MEQGMSLLSALDSQIQVVVPFGHHWSLTSNNGLKCQQQTENVFKQTIALSASNKQIMCLGWVICQNPTKPVPKEFTTGVVHWPIFLD